MQKTHKNKQNQNRLRYYNYYFPMIPLHSHVSASTVSISNEKIQKKHLFQNEGSVLPLVSSQQTQQGANTQLNIDLPQTQSTQLGVQSQQSSQSQQGSQTLIYQQQNSTSAPLSLIGKTHQGGSNSSHHILFVGNTKIPIPRVISHADEGRDRYSKNLERENKQTKAREIKYYNIAKENVGQLFRKTISSITPANKQNGSTQIRFRESQNIFSMLNQEPLNTARDSIEGVGDENNGIQKINEAAGKNQQSYNIVRRNGGNNSMHCVSNQGRIGRMGCTHNNLIVSRDNSKESLQSALTNSTNIFVNSNLALFQSKLRQSSTSSQRNSSLKHQSKQVKEEQMMKKEEQPNPKVNRQALKDITSNQLNTKNTNLAPLIIKKSEKNAQNSSITNNKSLSHINNIQNNSSIEKLDQLKLSLSSQISSLSNNKMDSHQNNRNHSNNSSVEVKPRINISNGPSLKNMKKLNQKISDSFKSMQSNNSSCNTNNNNNFNSISNQQLDNQDILQVEEDNLSGLSPAESYNAVYNLCPQAFSKEYHSALVESQVNLVEFLKKHKLSSHLRPKMIDWMIEVVAYVFKRPTMTCLFKCVSLMDLYLKHTDKIIEDFQIHLIGVGCLVLTNHFDQICEVSLQQFFEEVAHRTLEKKQIVAQEIEILSTIDFQLNFSVTSDFVNQYIYFLQKTAPSIQFTELTQLTYTYLLQSYFFEEMMNFEPRLIALSALFVSLENILSYAKDSGPLNTKFSSIQKSILGEFGEGLEEVMSGLAFCIKNVKLISANFININPKLQNYKTKFSRFMLN